jgi:glycine cleavage system H protein
MTETLELNLDKFIFRIATDRFYSREGIWAKRDGPIVRLGLSDYLQQRNGDIAFVEVKPAGVPVKLGDEIAVIETIKVNISLPSPVNGKVIEVNPLMETEPDVINQDPYGSGWLVMIEAKDWETDKKTLIDAQTYFSRIKDEAEEEIGRK